MSSTGTHTPSILVFDSGVGGLSIIRAIKRHTNANIIYVSDNAAFPYGTKSEAVLIERTKNVLQCIQQRINADIIVIACNTASTITLPSLRESMSVPVIGVVPAIKPAAELSNTKVIGLLATPGTVSRSYTNDLIEKFAHNCRIISVGSTELVRLAEEKLKGNAVDSNQLINLIKPFNDDKKIDTIVLACTHFPLLLDELKAVLPNITHWVDSGGAIASRVNYWIEELGLEQPLYAGEHQSFFTQKNDSIVQLKSALSANQLSNTHFIELPFIDKSL